MNTYNHMDLLPIANVQPTDYCEYISISEKLSPGYTNEQLMNHAAKIHALRFKEGAFVIHSPSGSIPTISECACWLI